MLLIAQRMIHDMFQFLPNGDNLTENVPESSVPIYDIPVPMSVRNPPLPTPQQSKPPLKKDGSRERPPVLPKPRKRIISQNSSEKPEDR